MPPSYGHKKNKTLGQAYLWYWTLGLVGGHHFYLGNTPRAWVYVFTVGWFTVGWFFDMFRMDSLVRKTNDSLNLQNIAANTAAQLPPR